MFEEDGLPEIGAIIKLNVNVKSFSTTPVSFVLQGHEWERWVKIKEAEINPFIFDEINKTMIINNGGYKGVNPYHARRGDWDLNAGMTVNYQHIDNILFAWVEILD